MNLPFQPPLPPMLAKRLDTLPEGPDFLFEPKWDGFRVLIFRSDSEILIQSRESKSLNRYFPELAEPLLQQLPTRCVLDGELVVPRGTALDFEALQLRIHPAASRVKTLSKEMPASLVFWDLLCEGAEDLRQAPFRERRARLEKVLLQCKAPVYLTPVTRDRSVGEDWLKRFEGAGLDGVMAKPLGAAYESDKRTLFKIKHERTCECVVAGFRWHKKGQGTHVGSLLLGLYADDRTLQHVGVAASFTDKKRQELVTLLEPLRANAGVNHPWSQWGNAEDAAAQRMPGAKSRWTGTKDLTWELLRPELVVEVAYDHMEGARFRHIAQFRRWRTDKSPDQCTYAQLETAAPFELQRIFQSNA